MNRQEILLTIAIEECAEIIQRITKIQRFGVNEVQPGQEKSNLERVNDEIMDFVATLEMLHDEKILLAPSDLVVATHCQMKRAKVEKYLAYSKECGTYQESRPHLG